MGRPVPDVAGVVESSRDAVLSRWREVVVHHGDLGLGAVPLPPELVEAWLPRELPRLAERTDPALLGVGHRPGRTRPRWRPGSAPRPPPTCYVETNALPARSTATQ